MIRRKTRVRSFIITAAVGSVLIMTLLIVSLLWTSKRTFDTTDDAVSAVSAFYLDAMAYNNANTITNLINSNFDHMEKAVEIIGEDSIESQEELRDVIGKITRLQSLSGFALVDEDNTVYTQYTTYTGGSRHDFLSEEHMDERIVSTVYLYDSSRRLCLTVPTKDLTIMGKPFRACFVQIDIKDIVDLLAVDDQDRTHFGLYSKNGGNLLNTELGPIISGQNLFDATAPAVSQSVREELYDNFANERSGSLTFISNGVEETISYVPVQDTGWEMVVLIRENVISDQIRGISESNLTISRWVLALLMAIMLIFGVILLILLRGIGREELEAERETSNNFRSMANTDSMTGVRNKHAYSDTEQALNQKIRDNEIDRLAVVVCDINGLKHVNDTQGHAAGDKLIVDASAMICDHFTHGSVYRIGGDEFVVLLQGKGYDTMNEVIDELNRVVEANIAEDAVVISIGYSVLKKEDELVHDVFERADQMMYERKKQLKAMGAKTRQD